MIDQPQKPEAPKEFWLAPDMSHPEDFGDQYFGDALLSHPQQGPLAWQAGLIHVIEKSYTDLLERKLATALSAMKLAVGDWDGNENALSLDDAIKEIEAMK